MLEPPRGFPRRLQQEGVGPGSVGAQQPILPILNHRVLAHFGQVTTHQGEVVIAIRLPNFTDPLQRRLVAYMTAERIAGIGRIHDYRTCAQSGDGLANESALRGHRMELQIDAHDVGYDTRMLQLLEWSPLLIFGATYKFAGIYWATAALMIACTALMLIHRLRTGRFKPMHVITATVAILLGSATLLLHDKRFIEWKPTVLLGITSAAFLGSMLFGSRPLARRLLESVFDAPLEVSERTWYRINLLWVAFLAALAFVNIYIAWNFSESTWVTFKVYGIPGVFFVFMFPQALWLGTKLKPAAVESA